MPGHRLGSPAFASVARTRRRGYQSHPRRRRGLAEPLKLGPLKPGPVKSGTCAGDHGRRRLERRDLARADRGDLLGADDRRVDDERDHLAFRTDGGHRGGGRAVRRAPPRRCAARASGPQAAPSASPAGPCGRRRARSRSRRRRSPRRCATERSCWCGLSPRSLTRTWSSASLSCWAVNLVCVFMMSICGLPPLSLPSADGHLDAAAVPVTATAACRRCRRCRTRSETARACRPPPADRAPAAGHRAGPRANDCPRLAGGSRRAR